MKHPSPLFHSATLRLTAWYAGILLGISILFSLVLLQISTLELRRSFEPPHPGEESYTIITNDQNSPINSSVITDPFAQLRAERISKGRTDIISELILFNAFVLIAGAGGSYLLARRTLRPVEDALESQTRFSSDAAHELRTPLTIMQSEIEVGLRDKNATKTTYSDLLTSTLDEVEYMRTLTDRLLLLANHNELALAPTSLEDVAIEAVNHNIPLAQKKKISINNTVGTMQVNANPDSLTDVVSILIENAIKYSPEKSTITLSASRRNKFAELNISDTGIGITPQDLPHIFDRFYRADTSRSSQNVTGHGLGLSIAKQIIDIHHGTIQALPNQAGKGTTFTITLPLA